MALALTGLGRVFVNSSGRQGGNRYKYHSCMKVDGVDKSLGDVTPIYCPKPDQYDEFIEVGTIKGADSRATSTLTGYLPIDGKGVLEDIYNHKCGFDLQVHYGQCNRPDEFNQFLSAMILKDVKLTSYALTTLTARTPDERAAVDETAAISIGDFYRIYEISEGQVKPSQFTGQVFPFGIVNASIKSCGDNCTERDDGCQVWIAGFVAANKSLHFLVTEDNGATWRLINARAAPVHNHVEFVANMILHSGYIYTQVMQGTSSFFLRTSVTSILSGIPDTITIAGPLNSFFYYGAGVSDNYVWFAGANSGASAITAINVDTLAFEFYTFNDLEQMRGVYALSDDVVVAVGENGATYHSNIHGVFTKTTTRVPIGSGQGALTVRMFGSTKWLVGSTVGIYYTNDSGVTWTKVLTTSGQGKFAFYDDIVGYYFSGEGTFRTLDSGNTWKQVGSHTATYVQNGAVCPSNPNLYWANVGVIGNSYFIKGSS